MAGESGRLFRMGNSGGGSSSFESVVVDTSGATITLDFAGAVQRMFVGEPQIDSDRDIALSDAADALQLVFDFSLDAAHSLQFPATFRMSDALWDSVSQTWTAIDAGRYQATAFFDGTLWNMTIIGAFV